MDQQTALHRLFGINRVHKGFKIQHDPWRARTNNVNALL